jgi:hypothetical protein
LDLSQRGTHDVSLNMDSPFVVFVAAFAPWVVVVHDVLEHAGKIAGPDGVRRAHPVKLKGA